MRPKSFGTFEKQAPYPIREAEIYSMKEVKNFVCGVALGTTIRK